MGILLRILIVLAAIVCIVALVTVGYAFVLSGTIAQREEDERGIRRS